jgi:hypothetical protein
MGKHENRPIIGTHRDKTAYDKAQAKAWAINMGMIPHIEEDSGKRGQVWGQKIMTTQGIAVNRSKFLPSTSYDKVIQKRLFIPIIDRTVTISVKQRVMERGLNPNAFCHIATSGLGVTKKVIKEIKRPFHKPAKVDQEIPDYGYQPTQPMQRLDYVKGERQALDDSEVWNGKSSDWVTALLWDMRGLYTEKENQNYENRLADI